MWNAYYERPDTGIEEETGASIDFPSFDISNPNYDPHANDGERQFQLIGTPQRVGPPDDRRSNFLMAMANYSPHDSPGWAASRVVPFLSPISNTIVPRTALFGRADWGTQTRSMAMRGGRELNYRPAGQTLDVQQEDPSFDTLIAGAPVPKEFQIVPKTPAKKKK
jgi:hypothetical protein